MKAQHYSERCSLEKKNAEIPHHMRSHKQYFLTVACVSFTSECSTVLQDCSEAMCWLVIVTDKALI